ncbi:transcriptional regulator, partial [filamentous cyanobacterium CCP4]
MLSLLVLSSLALSPGRYPLPSTLYPASLSLTPTALAPTALAQSPIASDYRVTALQPDFTGDLWVGSWAGLARINPETGRVLQRVSMPSRTIEALAQDRVGRIWVGTFDGLVRVDPRTNVIT